MSSFNQSEAQRITSRFGEDSTALEVISGYDLTGAHVIVTGGASGLGLETVRALAGVGAEVTIAARDGDAGARAAQQLNTELGFERVHSAPLDLANLASVRAFAHAWSDLPLHLLINNAGVMACPKGYTIDGFETQFGTNHLGHFLLAVLLTPALKSGAPGRVISLSSSGHIFADIDFDDPHFRRRDYHPFAAYSQSKTANALFAVEYDHRHRDNGIRAFSVMPGVIETRLGRHITPELREQLGLKRDGGKLRYKSVQQGAATTVWAAVGRELGDSGGLYLEDCAQAMPYSRDLPQAHGVQSFALDPDNARRLWALSEASVM